MDTAPPLSMQFVTLLTDFTKDNGGTALRPHSHHVPKYPDDEADFNANMVQVEGKGGDVVVLHGATSGALSGLGSFKAWHLCKSSHLKPWQTISKTTSRGERVPPSGENWLWIILYPIMKQWRKF